MNQRVGATANGEQNETRLAVVGDEFLQASLTAGFVGSVSLNSIGAWPKMPMTAGSADPLLDGWEPTRLISIVPFLYARQQAQRIPSSAAAKLQLGRSCLE
jgi:hypothetical protein